MMTNIRRDVFVYISGAISPTNGRSVESNVAAAVDFYLYCLSLGIPAFCPHLGAIFPSAHASVSYDRWMEYDFAVIDRCTHVIMLDGWKESRGAVLEESYARSKGIPVLAASEIASL